MEGNGRDGHRVRFSEITGELTYALIQNPNYTLDRSWASRFLTNTAELGALLPTGGPLEQAIATLTDIAISPESLPRINTERFALFQVIAGRAEKAAVIVTTNLPFSEWTTVFPNARLCKAMVDRLTDRAHIVDTGDESYRFRRSLDKQLKKNQDGGQN